MITLRLSDLKTQASLSLLLRHHELTNENVSYFLINQSKAMTFIDHKVTRKLVRPVKSLNVAHDRILSYDVIGTKVLLHKLMKFPSKKKKGPNQSLLYYCRRRHCCLNSLLTEFDGVALTTLENPFKRMRFRWANSLVWCGRKANLCQKKRKREKKWWLLLYLLCCQWIFSGNFCILRAFVIQAFISHAVLNIFNGRFNVIIDFVILHCFIQISKMLF